MPKNTKSKARHGDYKGRGIWFFLQRNVSQSVRSLLPDQNVRWAREVICRKFSEGS